MAGADSTQVTTSLPLLFFVLCACNKHAQAIVFRTDLYSLSDGEIEYLPPEDDAIEGFEVNPPFGFFGSNYSDLYVSTNGQISVDVAETMYVPRRFPTNKIIIAPFWADVDIRDNGGSISYGVTRNTTQLSKAEDQIAATFPDTPFTPVYLFIATWDSVGYFNRLLSQNDRSLLNTFQCVLVTDGLYSFIMFLYPDGELQWTAGDTHGQFGRQGNPAAIAGFNFNDSRTGVRSEVKFANLPNSGNDAIVNLTETSNVGIPGLWIYRVDETELITPEPPVTTPAETTSTTNQETSTPAETSLIPATSPDFITLSQPPPPSNTDSLTATDPPGTEVGVLVGIIVGVIAAVSFLVIGCGAIIGYVLTCKMIRVKEREENKTSPKNKWASLSTPATVSLEAPPEDSDVTVLIM